MNLLPTSEEEITLLRERLKDEYKNLFLVTDPETGKPLYPVFQTLPIKKENRDYYAIVKNPVSLNTLKKRLPNYKNAQDFVNDAMFVPWNAKKYYPLGSPVNSLSDVLENYMRTIMIPRLRSFYPELKLPILKPSAEEIMQQQRLLMQTPLTLLTQAQSTQGAASVAAAAAAAVGMVSGGFNPTVSGGTTPGLLSPEQQQAILMGIPGVQIPGGGGIPAYTPSIGSQSPFQQQGAISSQTQSPDISTVSLSESPQVLLVSSRGTSHSHSSSSSKKHVKRGRPPIIDLPHVQRMKNVLKYLKKDTSINQNFINVFEKNPDMANQPDYYNTVSNPISLDEISRKIKTRRYSDFPSFQRDFELMIDNYKRYYTTTQNSDLLDQLLLLERSFNLLVAAELAKPDSDYIPEGEFRYPLNDVVVNGTTYRIGDWVFLKNPNDTSKPIIGQIFKLWSTSGGQKWLNACWYFRPEQTVHRVDRLFYKNEVMKTGQYRDHPVDDLQGKCYVVHFTRYQRGDPGIKLEGPLFICEFRYNENDKVFNKIRTWKACLPEEIRDIEEKTIPVTGRKFFKYPSPIRHLLPPNATYEDPIPEPQMGLGNGPPLVGAVYLRPRLAKDDLGEYSTSLELPRYVIKPGDPPEEGKIDYENGTITVDKPIANMASITRSMKPPSKPAQTQMGSVQMGPTITGVSTTGAATTTTATVDVSSVTASPLPPFPASTPVVSTTPAVPTATSIATGTAAVTDATTTASTSAAITAATLMATAAITRNNKAPRTGENNVLGDKNSGTPPDVVVTTVPAPMTSNDNSAGQQAFTPMSFPQLTTSTTHSFKLQTKPNMTTTTAKTVTTLQKSKNPSNLQLESLSTVIPTSKISLESKPSSTSSSTLTTPRETKPFQSKSRLQFIQSGILPNNKSSHGTHAEKTITEVLQTLRGKNSIPQVVADFPCTYVLPISFHIKRYRVQRADLNSMARRYDREEFLKRRKEGREEELWFRGPSVSIVERVISLGNRSSRPGLSVIMDHKHRRTIEYEEVEEIVDVDGTRSDVASSLEGREMKRRRLTTLSDDPETDSSGDKPNSGDKSLLSTCSPQIGLRPSTKFMAFLLRRSQRS